MPPVMTAMLAPTASFPFTDGPLLPVAVLAVAAGALFGGLKARRDQHRTRDRKRRLSAAVVTATVAALVCTAYSADTSWRLAAHYLDMRITAERTATFAAAELALFSMALMARQNLHGPRQAAGLPGVLVWLITAMQNIPAYAESGPVGGTVRALPGPVMAAVLWHLAMGIELRQRTPTPHPAGWPPSSYGRPASGCSPAWESSSRTKEPPRSSATGPHSEPSPWPPASPG
ncbi:hypothetical protein ACIRQT_11020 [Streptomyces californicus]|uniref:hypothetical protein n=1 Tax=Streptomyces californicus TaxID=67351 RepID=UPI0038110031